MRALEITEKELVLVDKERPRPKSVEVLVKVQFAGLCRTDLYVIDGEINVKKPLIPGHEFSGIVEEGNGRFPKGVRVAVNPIIPCGSCYLCLSGEKHRCSQSHMFGMHRDGCFAEYIAVPEELIYPIEDSVDLLDAAFAEPIAACLAVLNAGIRPQQRGLILGNSRIATLTRMLLERQGFESLDSVPSVGEHDFVIETCASTEIVKDGVKSLKPGGTFIVKSRSYKLVEFCFNDLIRKEISIKAVNYAPFELSISSLNNGIDLSGLVGEVFSLEEYEQALKVAALETDRKVFFRLGG